MQRQRRARKVRRISAAPIRLPKLAMGSALRSRESDAYLKYLLSLPLISLWRMHAPLLFSSTFRALSSFLSEMTSRSTCKIYEMQLVDI